MKTNVSPARLSWRPRWPWCSPAPAARMTNRRHRRGRHARHPEKVSFLTGLSIQGREAYVYVAMEKGYFKDAGLEVEVKPGQGTNANLQLLQSGQVDFAVLDITGALIEYGKGTFKDFTIVNAIQQRNLACLMALEGSGIAGPKDLAGKKIAYIPGGVVRTLFPTYAESGRRGRVEGPVGQHAAAADAAGARRRHHRRRHPVRGGQARRRERGQAEEGRRAAVQRLPDRPVRQRRRRHQERPARRTRTGSSGSTRRCSRAWRTRSTTRRKPGRSTPSTRRSSRSRSPRPR